MAFPEAAAPDPLTIAVRRVEGGVGQRLAAAGVLAAVVAIKRSDPCGEPPFAERALAVDQQLQKPQFADLVDVGEDDRMRLVAEGDAGAAAAGAFTFPSTQSATRSAGTFLLFEFNNRLASRIVKSPGPARRASGRPCAWSIGTAASSR